MTERVGAGGVVRPGSQIRARIALADDDPAVLESLTQLLEEAGYLVVGTASDGPAAVDLIAESRPDAAIVDLRMPYMTGVEVAEAFQRSLTEVPMILFSAYGDAVVDAAARNAGVRACLAKGCLPDEILAAVDAVTGPGHREPPRTWAMVSADNKGSGTRKPV